jgi:hypothetical protein
MVAGFVTRNGLMSPSEHNLEDMRNYL